MTETPEPVLTKIETCHRDSEGKFVCPSVCWGCE